MAFWYSVVLAFLIGVVIGCKITHLLMLRYMDDLGFPRVPSKWDRIDLPPEKPVNSEEKDMKPAHVLLFPIEWSMKRKDRLD